MKKNKSRGRIEKGEIEEKNKLKKYNNKRDYPKIKSHFVSFQFSHFLFFWRNVLILCVDSF